MWVPRTKSPKKNVLNSFLPILPKLMPAKISRRTVFGPWCCYSSDSHLPVLSTQQSLVLHHQDWRWKHLETPRSYRFKACSLCESCPPSCFFLEHSWCFHQRKWGWLVILASPLGEIVLQDTHRNCLLFLFQCVWTFGSFQWESLLLQTLMNNCFFTIRQHLWSMLGFKLDSLYGVRNIIYCYLHKHVHKIMVHHVQYMYRKEHCRKQSRTMVPITLLTFWEVTEF